MEEAFAFIFFLFTGIKPKHCLIQYNYFFSSFIQWQDNQLLCSFPMTRETSGNLILMLKYPISNLNTGLIFQLDRKTT